MLTGETIRAIRRIRNVSQIKLAQQSGMPQPYISQIEQHSRIITQEQETAILAALNVNEQQSEDLTQIVRHIADARKIEATCWAKLRQALQP
jgi:transcriptional regulator with XRE-family HTH domain